MRKKLLVQGLSVYPGVARGVARVVLNPSEHYDAFEQGEILVVKHTHPDYFPLMLLSSGMIGEIGGRTCHLAINAMELGKPAIVSAEGATTKIKDGMLIVLDATQGTVYEVMNDAS